jgi:methyl-accepting chemotaxis protein
MRVIAYNISPLEKKDNEFMQMQRLIDTKKHFLIEKQKKLRFIMKQNHFLEEVKSDYSKYYQVISKQKEDQIKALELINEYIHNLTMSGQLSKQNIKDAKEEQKKILMELKSIKSGIDSMIDDTNDIQQMVQQKQNYV